MGDFGDRWEPLIALAAVERLELKAYFKPDTWYPEHRPWARVSPDCIALDDDGRPTVIECKLRNHWSFESQGWDWERNKVPDAVRCQVTGQIEFARSAPDWWQKNYRIDPRDIEVAHVACCIDGQRLRVFDVPYDPELGGLLFESAARFVRDYVEPKRWPPTDDSEECSDFIRRLHPRAEGVIRAATSREQLLCRDIQDLGLDIKALEETKAAIENELRLAIGADLGIHGPGFVAKNSNRAGTTKWKAVAEDLAEQLSNFTGLDLALFAEHHRSEGSRTLSVKFGREK